MFLINIKYNTVRWKIITAKIYVGQFNSPCVKTFSRLIACVHTYEICRSTNCMHLQSAQGHKVVPKDGN